MQDRHFRYASLGAVLLVACALLAGMVGAASVIVSDASPVPGLSGSMAILSRFI